MHLHEHFLTADGAFLSGDALVEYCIDCTPGALCPAAVRASIDDLAQRGPDPLLLPAVIPHRVVPHDVAVHLTSSFCDSLDAAPWRHCLDERTFICRTYFDIQTPTEAAIVAALLPRLPLAQSVRVEAENSADFLSIAQHLERSPCSISSDGTVSVKALLSTSDRTDGTACLRALVRLCVTELAVADSGVAVLDAMPDMPSLQTLRVTRCRSLPSSFAAVAALQHLTRIDVSGTRIARDGFKALASLPSLQVLTAQFLENCSDASMAIIGSAPALTDIDLTQTSVGPRTLNALARVPRLFRVVLTDAFEATDDELSIVGSYRHMTHLDISGTPAAEATVNALHASPKLKSLVFSRSRLPDAALVTVCGIATLEALDLSCCSVGEATSAAIADHRMLKTLNVSLCNVSERAAALLATSKSLEHITATGFHGAHVRAAWQARWAAETT